MSAQSMLHAGRRRSLLGYGLMLVASGIGLWLVHLEGTQLVAPEGASELGGRATLGSPDILVHVLASMLAIIVVARLLGAAFRFMHQPAVIGEVIGGILIGPSVLGRISPEAMNAILPASVAPFLGIIAQLGVILFMFLVGLELDTTLLRKKTHVTVVISHASIFAPFLLGAGISLWLYPRLATRNVPFDVFAMFLGIAMSVTAFPVLARILTDRGMHKTQLGVIALSCAAVDDVSAWCLLALVVSMAKAHVSGALLTIALTVAFLAFMALVVRPLVHRALRAQELRETVSRTAVSIVLVGLLVSALATELIGIHAIFGAFLLGATIPHDSRLARELAHKLEDLVLVLLLPAFFAFTGMRTQIGLVQGAEAWLMCGVIVLVACVGKVGGTYAAARFTGLSRGDAASLGALMNTRGLMELVVLNIGLDLGMISDTLFAMMVVMALLTTLATSPLLTWIGSRAQLDGRDALLSHR